MGGVDHREHVAQLLEQLQRKHVEVDEGVEQCKLSDCRGSDGENVYPVLRCQRLELPHELVVEDGAPSPRRVAFRVAWLYPSTLDSF